MEEQNQQVKKVSTSNGLPQVVIAVLVLVGLAVWHFKTPSSHDNKKATVETAKIAIAKKESPKKITKEPTKKAQVAKPVKKDPRFTGPFGH